jgi:hypothetical protein
MDKIITRIEYQLVEVYNEIEISVDELEENNFIRYDEDEIEYELKYDLIIRYNILCW